MCNRNIRRQFAILLAVYFSYNTYDIRISMSIDMGSSSTESYFVAQIIEKINKNLVKK